jgi:hypothetical protein
MVWPYTEVIQQKGTHNSLQVTKEDLAFLVEYGMQPSETAFRRFIIKDNLYVHV